MNQVGDTVELMVGPIPSGSTIYSYVWDFWDGLSTATQAPFVVKVINIGGQPGTDELHYTCRPVAVDGQSVSLAGTLTANNPPTILPGVSLSANDGYFAYLTTLSLQAIDQDGDPITFAWYSAGTYLGAGTSSPAGTANGTWTGNNTQIIAAYPATANNIDVVVVGDSIVTCYVADDRGGTSSVNFLLRGSPNPPPSATTAAGFGNVNFDATTPPTARIGTGQTVDFTVFVAPMPAHILSFQWSFSGTNGWTMPPIYEYGTTSYLENGGLQNTVHRNIDAEVVSSGTQKVVVADVRVVATNVYNGAISHSDADYAITLIANSAPSAVTITRKVNGSPITGNGPVPSGSLIEFSADGTDPNGDVVFCKWRFAQPFAPNPVYFWGPKVLYDTTGYASLSSVQGSLVVTDWLGQSLTTVLPSTTIS
jgi:hypothetical protein